MGYRYETHLHTKEVSACARTRAADYISFYQERGYSGIIVTDHFFHGNCGISRNMPWKEWVEAYCRGYELAKEEGDRHGFSVFFGLEENFEGDEYLVYGLTKEWLLAHYEIMQRDRREYYRLLHEAGALVIQAHPCRERGYLSDVHLNPYFVDGAEIINLGNEPYQDGLAREYAKKHGLHVIAGSDMHCCEGNPVTGGIESDRKLDSIEAFIQLIKSGTGYTLIGEEERWKQAQEQKPWEHKLPVFQYSKEGRSEKTRD